MILIDTSVWIDHFRTGDDHLADLLNQNKVLMHTFILGELACANLQHCEQVITLLKDLPQSVVASDEEALFFIEQNQLMGKGIGYIDAHLLAAVALNGSTSLWTRDKHLFAIADSMHIAYIN